MSGIFFNCQVTYLSQTNSECFLVILDNFMHRPTNKQKLKVLAEHLKGGNAALGGVMGCRCQVTHCKGFSSKF